MSDLLELLWLDPGSGPGLRRRPAWQRLLDQAAAGEPAAPRPEIPHATASPEHQAEVFTLLACAELADRAQVEAAVSAGTSADGRYTAPLLLVAGELSLAIDPLEVLRGLAANASAFAAGDEPLQAAVAAVHAYTGLPGLIPTPHALDSHARRLREAFSRAPRPVPPDFLDTETSRALLEQRRYETCAFHGAPHLRAQLALPGAAPLPAFLPAEAAAWLPTARSFPVRALVEPHLHADQYEREPLALGILALARLVPRPGGEEEA